MPDIANQTELLYLLVQLISLAVGSSVLTTVVRNILASLDIYTAGRGAQMLSWGIAFALTVVSLASGWTILPEMTLGGLLSIWPTVSLLSNLAYTVVLKIADDGGDEGDEEVPPPPPPPVTSRRTTAA